MSLAVALVLTLVVILLVLAAVVYVWLAWRARRIEELWSEIDRRLARRQGLIDRVVAVTRRYTSREEDTLVLLLGARDRARAAANRAERATAENSLTQSLRRAFGLAESYPDLGADPELRRLRAETVELEDGLARLRRLYNDEVLAYDDALEVTVAGALARLIGFRPHLYFEGETAGRVIVE